MMHTFKRLYIFKCAFLATTVLVLPLSVSVRSDVFKNDSWIEAGRISGPGLESNTPLSATAHLWNRDNGALLIRPEAPTGTYTIEWKVPRPANATGVVISAKLRKNNLNQINELRVNTDNFHWNIAGSNSKDWTWEELRNVAWLSSLPSDEPLRLQWTFTKPGLDGNWQVGLENLSVVAATKEEVERTVADFRKPMAEGLPPLADPRLAKKPWKSKLEVKNGQMLKDGQPFFPIGYVFGTDERSLAQAAAMGCNAIHFDVGWAETSGPKAVAERDFANQLTTIKNASAWGMAAFPLLTGHYVPDWFARDYPSADASPMGSDGKPTGSWFPYSIHYPPFRDSIPDFWRTAAASIGTQPSVMALNFWNEPSYGGTWNKGSQFGDYSVWGIANYRTHLKQKYSELSSLQTAHNQQYVSFETVNPPRTPDELGRAAWLDWMEYGQSAFGQFFETERAIINKAAPQVKLANKKQTNMWDNSTASSGTNWELMGRSEDIFGINAYIGSEVGARDIFEGARSYANGKPVVVFETNIMPPGAATRTPDRVRAQFWSQVLGGANGIFIFSMAANDTEHGLLNDHSVSPEARKEYVKFTQTVSKHQRELSSPIVKSRVAVLYSTTGALQTANDSVPKHVMGAYDLFRNSQYQVDTLPQERCSLAGLNGYDILVLPSYSILKHPEEAAIQEWLGRGGKVIAFGNSLSKNENFENAVPPKWMGIDARQPPIGDRTEQRLSWIEPKLQSYLTGEININDAELVSALKDGQSLLPGGAIKTEQSGQVLAYNSDSYPTVLLNRERNVIYCAFASRYSNELRGLIEGMTREYFGVRQNIRFKSSNGVEAGIMTSLRQDAQDPNRRYLLALNTLHEPRSIQAEIEQGWSIVGEKIHDLKAKENTLSLKPREVYLFELRRKV